MDTCWSCRAELPAGARFCPSCGAETRAVAGRQEERKVVSVLFADLVGWTSRSERLDPEDVRAMLAPFHARVRAEIERLGGRVEKFIGDAVMALFGAPAALGDDPERAVLAALSIRHAVAALNEERGFDLHVRIGVATGEAVVDLGARPELGEGMAAGDVVNTGFRLAEAASVDGIVVDAATYGATQDAIEYRAAEPVQVKGKEHPLHVWEAVGRRTGPGPAAGTPFLGRSGELELLLDAFARAPQLVTVLGVPGIGKTRLVGELASALEAAGTAVRWLRGRSLSYGEETPFWALGEIVKAQAGIVRTDDSATAEEKLGRAVREVVEDAATAERVESHLRPLVGLPGDERARQDSRDESFLAWHQFFEALARRERVVLVFEDIHWADEGLLEFIDRVAATASAAPLLIVCTARPALLERHPGWGGGQPRSRTISLGPLSNEHAAELVSTTLGGARLPEEVEAAVLARAEGNPLYAEEYARMLVDRGYLGAEGEPGELPLPESVQGIIAARLDGLPPDEKGLLQDAAVFGRVFSLGAVASMTGLPRYAVNERLGTLERKQFLRREEVPSASTASMYGFLHVLVRDVAYAQIPRARRAEKHRQAAVWIESLKSERQDLAEMVAHHYQGALSYAEATGQDTSELASHARDALWEAGERSLALNGFEAAARFLEAALNLWPADDEERPRVLFAYAKSLFHRGSTGATHLVAARDGLLASGANEEAAEAEIMLAYLALWHRGDHDAAFTHLEAAQALVTDAPPSRAKAYVLANAAHFLGLADQQERAIVVGVSALALARELGLEDIQAQSLRTIGWLRAARGDAAGYDDLEKSIEISRARNSPEFALAYVNLAGSHIIFGDLRRAFDVLVEARSAAARFGRVHGSTWLLDVSQVTEDYWCGRWDEAVARADTLISERRALAYLEAWIREVRGQVRLARGDPGGALEDSAGALERAQAAKDTQVLYPALAFRGRALAATGQNDAGEPLDELLSRLTGEEWSMAYFWIDLALALRELGREDDLRAALERVRTRTRWVGVADALAQGDLEGAADRCAEIGTLPDEAYMRLLAARALAEAGRHDEAESQLERALAFHRSVGADAYVRQAERLAVALAGGRV